MRESPEDRQIPVQPLLVRDIRAKILEMSGIEVRRERHPALPRRSLCVCPGDRDVVFNGAPVSCRVWAADVEDRAGHATAPSGHAVGRS